MAANMSNTHSLPAAVHSVLRFLRKIDELQLPPESQQEMEHTLVLQASVLMESFTRHNPGHGKRTAGYCVRLGDALGLSREEVHDLRLAGMLHDIGLLMLDATLLARPEAWDVEDYARVQSHPRIGAELLGRFAFLTSAAQIVAHHHERWDGSGYPFGLRGSFIPLGARILAIADSFDSVQIPRDSDSGVRKHVAFRILRLGAGSQFDPILVDVFESAIGARPDADDQGSGSAVSTRLFRS